MKTLTLNKWGGAHPITFDLDKYRDNGNLSVYLITHDEGYPAPWQNLTVNLGVKLEENCAFIDTNNNGNEIIDWLISNGIGQLTGRAKQSGFCFYPEFRFNMDKLNEYS